MIDQKTITFSMGETDADGLLRALDHAYNEGLLREVGEKVRGGAHNSFSS